MDLPNSVKKLGVAPQQAYDAIMRRATAEKDDLEELRIERRLLVQGRKHLKAMKDVSKTNARAAQVIEDRNKKEFERQQTALDRAMSDPCLT
ncbi:unnamed protein product [Durusdinium trenchii]